MESQLDILHWTKWFLEECDYFESELELVLAEVIRRPEPDKNTAIPGAHRAQVRPESRRFRVFFNYVLLFQVVDNSHSKPKQKEKNSEGVLEKFNKSAFLDYVEATYQFQVHEQYNHYRIKTTNEYIDAISIWKPIISEIRP
jgi:hypothetical protein